MSKKWSAVFIWSASDSAMCRTAPVPDLLPIQRWGERPWPAGRLGGPHPPACPTDPPPPLPGRTVPKPGVLDPNLDLVGSEKNLTNPQCVQTRVADPDPDLSDPYVFGPPGSGFGSINQRYGSGSRSGSGSFYYQAKIVRKTLIPTALWLLFDFLSSKKYVNVPSKSNKQKNFLKY